MKILLFLASIALSLAALAEGEILSEKGYGPVKYGEPLTTIEARFSEHTPQPSSHELSCYYVQFAAFPEIRFMVENGVLTRGEALGTVPNTLGVQMRMPLGEIQSQYPTAQIQPHKYNPNGHYLILKSTDEQHAIVMEAADGVVTKIRSGLEPSVEYVEGCS